MKFLKYDDIIRSVSEIVNNEMIFKENLALTYKVSKENIKKLNEHIFYKYNDVDAVCPQKDMVEIELGGITVILISE